MLFHSPISNVTLPWVVLVLLGFVIGVLGGFFGVGGSFLAGPALFRLGMPMNFVVGTDVAHVVGKSVVAAKRHAHGGNVDLKLGLVMTSGTLVGVELGAQTLERLKQMGKADIVVAWSYIVILTFVSLFTAYEGWQALQMQQEQQTQRRRQLRVLRALGRLRRLVRPGQESTGEDVIAFPNIIERIHNIGLPPIIHFPVSGIKISLWAVLVVGVFAGFLGGALGGGAGYIRLPALVYIIGAPTHVAVGTDLFEVIISAGYGTITHSLKGNVDFMIALVMQVGAAIGAQLGVSGSRLFTGPKLRLAFSALPLIGIALVVMQLLSGRASGG